MRLRNTDTGVVVSVSDDTAARLGSKWAPVDDVPAKASKPATRRRSSKTTEQE